MGVYNPNKPYVLGNEWVPIREVDIQFNQLLDDVEYGQRFTTSGSSLSLTEGRFYVNEFPESFFRNQCMSIAVYPAGKEDKSGPINSVVIPCSSGNFSGTGISFTNAASVGQALFNPSDNRFIRIAMGNGNQGDIGLFFDVISYAPLLTNKRILGVNFLYAAEEITAPTSDDGQKSGMQLSLNNSGGSTIYNYPAIYTGTNPTFTSVSPFQPGVINRIALGNTNGFFNPTSGVAAIQAMPWTYTSLTRLDPTFVGAFIETHLFSPALAGAGPVISLDYAALEVVYCEEQRIAVGTTLYGTSNLNAVYTIGANVVTLFDLAGSPNPVLAANTEYTVTVSEANMGDSSLSFTVNRIGPQPKLNALRQLDSIPDNVAIQLNKPTPPTPLIDGQVFTETESDVNVQLSLHHTGGVVDEVNVYGRQSVAQVYSNGLGTWASQVIKDDTTSTASYTQARIYARRFGNTTGPLVVNLITSPDQQGLIYPVDFDALPELVDGWKEVTLRLHNPITMGGGTGPKSFEIVDQIGDNKGDRWEVLGATAPALSGRPNTSFTLATTQLSSATYGTPTSGASILESWMPQYAPPVTAKADDPTSDMVLMFSTDAPAPSGFAVVQLSQALSGIGLNCGIAPQFIPTALTYNQLTWTMDYGAQAWDNFTRTVASGWGTATDGQAWSVTGGSASDFSVSNGAGNILLSTAGAYRIGRLGTSADVMKDVNGYVEIWSNSPASGADHWGALTLRDDGSNNHLYAEVNFQTDHTVRLILSSVVSGVHTVLGTFGITDVYIPGTRIKLRVQARGTNFKGKAWVAGDEEPEDWLLEVATGQNPQAGRVGFRAIAGAPSPPVTVSYDNLLVAAIATGYTEIQRMDTVDSTWQTIMSSSANYLPVFNDYEARVGILTSYRIRNGNINNFPGPWSATITTTIPAPGVTAAGLTATDHVWIFTSNEDQTGAKNLAYALAWEGEVSEDFNFPESAGQVIQTMYNRDYVTVFRPLERGGTNFTRNVLVQAAAIAPETLEDFTSLRDMAWATVPYICLRDEDGNRWFSNVSVTASVVLRDRRLYMAPVNVVEVTDTPSPVDIAWS
jgi:hypothetical protein